MQYVRKIHGETLWEFPGRQAVGGTCTASVVLSTLGSPKLAAACSSAYKVLTSFLFLAN